MVFGKGYYEGVLRILKLMFDARIRWQRSGLGKGGKMVENQCLYRHQEGR